MPFIFQTVFSSFTKTQLLKTILYQSKEPPLELKRKIIESCSHRIVNHQETKSKLKPKLSDLRSYGDDEPLLLSPTADSRFIPIPEADEDIEHEPKEEDVEEFQGFFVNAAIKSDDVLPFNGRDSRNVQVRLASETTVVSAGREYETYAMALKIKALPPPSKILSSSKNNINNPTSHLDHAHRVLTYLITVLYVSGSMTGAKIKMLKESYLLIVGSIRMRFVGEFLGVNADERRG